MRKILSLFFLVALAAAFNVRAEHQYWYNANKKLAEQNVPYVDVAWNYCDLKCITFEKLYPGNDFFVLNFKDSSFKPNFSACFVKKAGDTGKGELWNTVAKNTWFNDNCGADTENYLNNSKYTQDGEALGAGIGTLITY